MACCEEADIQRTVAFNQYLAYAAQAVPRSFDMVLSMPRTQAVEIHPFYPDIKRRAFNHLTEKKQYGIIR